jgi:YesN/AraC family two-component response regulator
MTEAFKTIGRFTVVIIEDSTAMRDMLAMCLATTELELVGKAGSGEEGVALCRAKKPHVVFLDVVMPGMSGVDVLKILTPELPDTRFLMITSISERNVVLRSEEYGATDYILKPFDWDELRARVAELVIELSGDGL